MKKHLIMTLLSLFVINLSFSQSLPIIDPPYSTTYGDCSNINIQNTENIYCTSIHNILEIYGFTGKCNETIDSISFQIKNDTIIISKEISTCQAMYQSCIIPFKLTPYFVAVDDGYTIKYMNKVITVSKYDYYYAHLNKGDQFTFTIFDTKTNETIKWYTDSTLTNQISTGETMTINIDEIKPYTYWITRTIGDDVSLPQKKTLVPLSYLEQNQIINNSIPFYKSNIFIPAIKNSVSTYKIANKIGIFKGNNFKVDLKKEDTALNVIFEEPFSLSEPSGLIEYNYTITHELPFLDTKDTTIKMNIGDSVDMVFESVNKQIPWAQKSNSKIGLIDTLSTYKYENTNSTYKIITLKATSDGIDTLIWQYNDGQTVKTKRVIIKIGDMYQTPVVIKTNPKEYFVCSNNDPVIYDPITFKIENPNPNISIIDTIYNYGFNYNDIVKNFGIHYVSMTIVFNNGTQIELKDTITLSPKSIPPSPIIKDYYYEPNQKKNIFVENSQNEYSIYWEKGEEYSYYYYSYSEQDTINYIQDTIGDYYFRVVYYDSTTDCRSNDSYFTIHIVDPAMPSISGTINDSSAIIQLFEKSNDKFIVKDVTEAKMGVFNFKYINKGTYIIKAIPATGNTNHVPTYYVSTTNWEEASSINLLGKASGIDISFIDIIPTLNGDNTISGNIQINDSSFMFNDVYKSFKTLQLPIVVKQNGNIIAYAMTDIDGNYTISNLPDGEYSIAVDLPGNKSSDQKIAVKNGSNETINFTVKNGTALLDSKIEASEIVIYPNPAQTQLNIKGLTKGSTIEIIDIVGRSILKTNNSNIDVSKFNPGQYLIRIISANYINTMSFIKE